jgi:hypothetical protein
MAKFTCQVLEMKKDGKMMDAKVEALNFLFT